MTKNSTCPGCGSSKLEVFYQVDQVPVHSVQLLTSKEAAIQYPRGDIQLGYCHDCGFISNLAFDPSLHDYANQYESTQSFSQTFNSFANALADTLVSKYDLHDKNILEIGCGQGEFLTMLCEKGENRGIGFDPAYRYEPELALATSPVNSSDIQFINDYYSEKYTDIQADFTVCKMTLEHIQQPGEFVRMVRRAVGDRRDAIVFFQIPDVTRILEEAAFWDIYYEHCSYFSPGSLRSLFQRSGFEVLEVWNDYDGQYLMISARPGEIGRVDEQVDMEYLSPLNRLVNQFRERVPAVQAEWKDKIQADHAVGKKTMLWGSGSKGVAFLTTLHIDREIEYCVDINPNKTGTFMAGTGQEIVAPEFCATYQPDAVIAMNPIYLDEIRAQLASLGQNPDLAGLGR